MKSQYEFLIHYHPVQIYSNIFVLIKLSGKTKFGKCHFNHYSKDWEVISLPSSIRWFDSDIVLLLGVVSKWQCTHKTP